MTRGGNIGASVGEDGVFIIDDHFFQTTDKITAPLKAITDRPVDFIVYSHFHFDHTGANVHFGGAGATIVAQDNSRNFHHKSCVL